MASQFRKLLRNYLSRAGGKELAAEVPSNLRSRLATQQFANANASHDGTGFELKLSATVRTASPELGPSTILAPTAFCAGTVLAAVEPFLTRLELLY